MKETKKTQAFSQVNLVTASKEFVHTIIVPPFNVFPDVIVWGTRIFVNEEIHRDMDTFQAHAPQQYYEAFAWHGEASDSMWKVEAPKAHEPEEDDVVMCSPPAGKNFETALMEQFHQHPEWMEDENHKQIYHMLNEPDSRRKRRRLVRMERAARGSLGLGTKAAIDWSNIDWKTVGLTILKVLVAILPLLFMIL